MYCMGMNVMALVASTAGVDLNQERTMGYVGAMCKGYPQLVLGYDLGGSSTADQRDSTGINWWATLGDGQHLAMGNTRRWATVDDVQHLALANTWRWATLDDGQHLTMGNAWRWATLGDGQHLAMGNFGWLVRGMCHMRHTGRSARGAHAGPGSYVAKPRKVFVTVF
jgi:hypothetical protein